MNLDIERLDHLVLTVADIEATCSFYARVLGMHRVSFRQGRTALLCGGQKINLHQVGREWEPRALRPTPGSADLCLITRTPLQEVIGHLRGCEVRILEGPVGRTGARGAIVSLYFQDPDGNLIEVANDTGESGSSADRGTAEPSRGDETDPIG